MPKVKSYLSGGFFTKYELHRREFGHKFRIGWERLLNYSLYSSMRPCNAWDTTFGSCNAGEEGGYHGGIFNLEFSPDGRQLAAACENRAVLLFDSLSKKLISDVKEAHTTCVNGVKFLDDRLFATCSDDKTVALWDIRHLSRNVLRLVGHNHWVKNIEYSSPDGLLITSGFDGRILGWDINRYAEESPSYTELFSMKGLMRTRLSPDMSKLVVCTTAGYIVVIHDLSLEHLPADLKDFKPNTYRLMQISNASLDQSSSFARHLFTRRNRVELISDFPADNDAEIIHSLQVHPQGWCVLSRNTSTADSSEWTCVHDIQKKSTSLIEDPEDDKVTESSSVNNDRANSSNTVSDSEYARRYNLNQQTDISEVGEESQNINLIDLQPPPITLNSRNDNNNDDEDRGEDDNQTRDSNRNRDFRFSFTVNPRMEITFRQRNRRLDNQSENNQDNNAENNRSGVEVFTNRRFRRRHPSFVNTDEDSDDSDNEQEVNVHLRFRSLINETRSLSTRNEQQRQSHSNSEDSTNDAAINRNVRRRVLRPRLDNLLGRERRISGETSPYVYVDSANRHNILVFRTGFGSSTSIVLPLNRERQSRSTTQRVPGNNPRLMHYIEEPNKGKGFIKELCFSSDGRVIGSPYDCGVRLLAFDDKCSELSHCVPDSPRRLEIVSHFFSKSSRVVSTKFSPKHCTLVSGCLDGKLMWYQPIL